MLRIDFGCGRVPPASMAVGHTEHLLQEPLGEFSLGGAALLEVVTHFPLERAGETDEPGPLLKVLEGANPPVATAGAITSIELPL